MTYYQVWYTIKKNDEDDQMIVVRADDRKEARRTVKFFYPEYKIYSISKVKVIGRHFNPYPYNKNYKKGEHGKA